MRKPRFLSRPKKTEPQHIPQRGPELTAAWFTDVLGMGATVLDVRCETIGTDVGFMGEVIRCHLTWTDDAPEVVGRPDSVIVKVPTLNDENFAVGDAMQVYEREIVVYRRFGSSLGLPLPAFFYGAMDPNSAPWLDRPLLFLFDHLPLGGINWVIAQLLKLAGKSKRRYILVLEDIADARPPSQLVGGSVEDAHQALDVLARFHAANWMRTDVPDGYAKVWPLDRGSRVFQASYLRNRDAFVERFGTFVGDDLMARLDDIQARAPDIAGALAAEPWTVLHGDYRLDNLLFRPDDEIVVLDLQGVSTGRPAFDVAYFITTALTAEHRDEEQRLLGTYHDALVDAGVTSYSLQQLIDDCALTKELLAHRFVGGTDVLDTELSGDRDSFLDVLQFRVLDWLD
ncbi:MAG: phosphotransferase [Acidimicrobiia bacterium]|nr:phosphotransferase [Acidimicrobiia bacterium]